MFIRDKKNKLAELLHQNGILLALRAFLPKTLVCFSYHRIASQGPRLFCSDVFGPSQTQFFEQMRLIKKYSHPISEEELIDSVKTQKPLHPRSVLITFDDGYRDNYTLAYPVLRDLNIPAIFFIPTQLIQDKRLGWWDLIPYYIKSSFKNEILLTGKRHKLASDPEQRLSVIRAIQNQVKRLESDQTEEVLKALAIECKVQPPSPAIQAAEIMTWSQIQEISKSVVALGSHTHSHRVLSTLSLAEQHREFVLSKQILEEQIQKPIRSIAYPVGGYDHFFSETRQIAKSTGYELGFSHLTGANPIRLVDPYDVKRISVPARLSRFSCSLILPEFFAEALSDRAALRSVRTT